MLTLKQAFVIVLAIMVVCMMAKILFGGHTFAPLFQTNVTKIHPHPLEQPPVGSKLSFLSAISNNTLEMRPGSKYHIDVFPEAKVPPAFVITLYYRPGCTKHHLVMLFEHIAKEMIADGSASTANIEFNRVIVDPTNPANLVGGFPKIVKTRRTGQTLQYNGYTDYGPLRDWILNEGLLF